MKTSTLICILVTGTFFFTSCDNGTTTSVQTKTDSPQMGKNDAMDKKMSNNDMKNMDNDLTMSMNTMMEKMTGTKMTGDFDIDFANMMVVHHQGAIAMSEAEIKSGTDEKLKTMARNIITNQKAEQNKLGDFVKNNKPMKMDMGQGDALNKNMQGMKASMGSMKMAGNTDKDFAMMMIAHHEGAVKMAKDEVSYGMKAAIKQMAKSMISDQTKEIGVFKAWLAAQK